MVYSPYPAHVVLQIATLEPASVLVLTVLEELHLLDNILPFLHIHTDNGKGTAMSEREREKKREREGERETKTDKQTER